MELTVFELGFLLFMAFVLGWAFCILHRNEVEMGLKSQISELKRHVKSMQAWMRDANGKDI